MSLSLALDSTYAPPLTSIAGSTLQLNLEEINVQVADSLVEDIGEGDITSMAVIPAQATATAVIRCRETLCLAGLEFARAAFRLCDPKAEIDAPYIDGETVEAGSVIATVSGLAQPMMAAERTAINYLQILSGIATLTQQYVEALRGTNTKLLDTRKTLPGLRMASKYATAMGGAVNHRLRLDDAVLIKDNHLALSGLSLSDTVRLGRKAGKFLMVECDAVSQAEEALEAGAQWLLLDNMSLQDLRRVVKFASGVVPLEASGGVNLNNIRAIAETGVDYVSAGALTHSARAVDIGLDITAASGKSTTSVPYLA